MSNLRPPGSFPSFDQRAWWGPRAPDSDPMSIVQLIRVGTLDANLAALAWLLVEARVPLIVGAGPRLAGKTTLLTALLEFLPPTAAVHELDGYAEQFAWLPEAERLGWRPDRHAVAHRHGPATAPAADAAPAADGENATTARQTTPANGYLVASELSEHLPLYTWGEQARIAVRSLSLGYGLGATIHADSLEDVFEALRGPDVKLTDDELSNLGLVLILRAFRGDGGHIVRRVAAAHFVRPISRDAGGHVQRLAPAVLATWDPRRDAFEHFAWGVTPELAMRAGRKAGDFEAEHARRRDVLTALAAAGVESFAEVRAAVDGYRLVATTHRH